MGKIGERYTTGDARRTFTNLSARLRGDFQLAAIDRASKLAGTYAKNQFQSALDANRNALVNDPMQFDKLLTATHEP